MILLSKSTTLTLSVLALTIVSALNNGGICKSVFLFKLKNNFFSSSRVLNFAIFKRSRNSQNKANANIKGFTVYLFCLNESL